MATAENAEERPRNHDDTAAKPVSDRFFEERVELGAVLSSDALRRSNNLRAILTTICERYFAGEEHTSEFHIALDALHRSDDFNPLEDATVRVNVHNLRKKLKEFYESEGKDHRIRIQIPSGRYIPEFTRASEPAPAARVGMDLDRPSAGDSDHPSPADEVQPTGKLPREEPISEGKVEQKPPARPRLTWLIASVVCALAILGTAVWTRHLAQRVVPKRAAAPLAVAQGFIADASAIRIATGSSGPFHDSLGQLWGADRWGTGGSHFNRKNQAIARTTDQGIFQSGREGQFSYDIPLAPGFYELHLYFADTVYHQETDDRFWISINGGPNQMLDVIADAGGAAVATAKVFLDVHPAKDGKLHLAFAPLNAPAFLNGIEILPGTPGRMRTLRQTTLANPYFDHAGNLWLPDQWFLGGRATRRTVLFGNTSDPELFTTERSGRFTYEIPVAEHHRYTVTLFFSEAWFRLMPSPREGLRVFDVSCNGTLLLKNFDILKESGFRNLKESGFRNEPVIRSFSHIESSPEGKIFLSFDPSVDYALINAIQIEDEGPTDATGSQHASR